MKILGIEWSSSQRTLALGEWSADDGMCLLGTAQLPEGRDSRYFETFQQLAAEADVSKSEIKAVVVGLGPGSYAGIRASISVAYGWHLANDAKLLGLSSARVMARKAFDQTGHSSIHTLIDAQRGECYHAQFHQSPEGGAEINQSLKIQGPEQIAKMLASRDCFVGENVERWFSGNVASQVEKMNVLPDAATLLKEAAGMMGQPGAERLEPIYLRPTSFVKAPPSRVPLSEEALKNL